MHFGDSSDMKALISFLMFVVCSLCGYSQSSVTGAQQMVAAQCATFNDIISIGELIKSVKEGNVGIKKMAERSGYAFRGRLTSSLKKHTFYNLLINNILYLCVT